VRFATSPSALGETLSLTLSHQWARGFAGRMAGMVLGFAVMSIAQPAQANIAHSPLIIQSQNPAASTARTEPSLVHLPGRASLRGVRSCRRCLWASPERTTSPFDAKNRLLSSTTVGEGSTTNTWNPDGTLRAVTHSNGTQSSYQYDRAQRLTSITHMQSGATTLGFVYQYDRNGNRLSEVKTQSAINGQAGSITTTVYQNRRQTDIFSWRMLASI